MIGSEGTFCDVARDLEITSLTLKGLVRRSVKFDFKGHNIVPIKGGVMGGLDIDESLPGEEVEEEFEEEVIRREKKEDTSSVSSSFHQLIAGHLHLALMRNLSEVGYLIAGAGYGLLVVYLFLVIFMEMKLPILSNENVKILIGL